MGDWLLKSKMSYNTKCNIFRLILTVGLTSPNLLVGPMSQLSNLSIKNIGEENTQC